MKKGMRSIGRAGGYAVGLGLLASVLAWGCCGCAPSDQTPSSAVDTPSAVTAPQAGACAACIARSQAEARARAQDQAAPSATTPPATATTQPVTDVTGARAQVDLGDVHAGTKHRVVFAVHNDSDKELKFTKVRGDCACITAPDAPKSIAAGQVVQVVTIFDAPNINSPYGAELIIMTDNPQRKIIRLAVGAIVHK